MASWNELREYARTNYELINDEPGWFGLLFETEEGCVRRVVVRTFKAYEREWIEVHAGVCRQCELPPEEALRRNAEMPIGFLGLVGGHYYVLHNAVLPTLESEAFSVALELIAQQADELGRQHSPSHSCARLTLSGREPTPALARAH